MNTLSLGNTIAKLRKKNNLTQWQLAEKLNVSDKAVSKWENGGGYPEISMLPLLSEVFGVSIDYLFKGETKGIAIAGTILVDIVNMIDRYPEKNMLANVHETEYAVGGCVPNTIIDIARIDPDIFLTAIGKVGNDDNGRYVLSQLKKYGIDVSKVKVDDNTTTGASNVMTEKRSGERTFFLSNGANRSFGIDDINIDELDCSIFHAGYILLLDALDAEDNEYGTKMARLLDMVSKRGIKTSIDVVSEEGDRFKDKIIPALRYCDYAMMNEIESCKVTGLSPRNSDGSINVDNIKKTMLHFLELGVREKVIVHCCEAGFMADKSGEFIIVPSLDLPDGYIKGSVGAGDAYAAACLYGIYKEWDNTRILEFAAAAAACNLTEADSISGMRSAEEIDKVSKQYKRRKI
ncbi:MAG: helix-turn-helix domain-containing protein [Clostridia bacterium]|nr:helix-turn-helix domain-containing protein [Clostridia bacterium]